MELALNFTAKELKFLTEMLRVASIHVTDETTSNQVGELAYKIEIISKLLNFG